jgi:hypothetical protein
LSHCNWVSMIFQTILTGLLICKDSFQKFISEITATFPLAQVGIMPSAAFEGTNGDDFTQDTYHT